ncbi:MAG: YgiQ family radical SAM protein [Deltaproteobacteria bacterium]|nr:YgiQ family radical SAM protein [Deltaproteobacteria bacterium]
MTRAEMAQRGWDYVDVVIVTGDAYVDHPSFAMAILGRVLESASYRVAILSQPDWHQCQDWKRFGRPRLFFGISAGNMDSMINHYTANKKVRNDDAYSPGGRIGLRPDRATLAYCQRAREAFPGVPVIAGGVEASLRRLAHYDYWSDTVKRSILLDSKADLVVYGMGEKPILEIAKRLSQGESTKDLRNMRGVAYALGALESSPSEFEGKSVLTLPSFESVCSDRLQFAEATKIIHTHTNPFNAAALVQYHGKQAVVVNPPDLPLSQGQMDKIYDLPYTRKAHPSYTEPIPAHQMIKDSVTIMRGCFGGCTFCSITAHQGKIIQSRSEQSILSELKNLGKSPEFSGVVSDMGGPTANMYQMRCTLPEIEAKCRRQSCIDPTICKLLGTDHGPLISVMKKSRQIPGIRKVFVASGVRMDLAQLSEEYMKELAAHHVGGLLKVAPEHTDKKVLSLMKKPQIENFESFGEKFKKVTNEVGKPKQYLVPYFIASHPGSDLNAMIDLALFLKRNGYKPDQVQDFIPAPFDVATCMYHTGLDPFTKKEVFIAKHLRDRKLQRALLQFFKPENYFEVRKALETAGRTDLIGEGCEALIPSMAPKEALRARMGRANQRMSGGYVHQIPETGESKSAGYRPKRATAFRQERNVKNFSQKKSPFGPLSEGRP